MHTIKTTKLLSITAFSMLTVFLSACGDGGESSSTSEDTTVPTISSTTPLNNADDVALNSTITVTFNEDILSTSVDATSFILAKASGENAIGSVSFDGANNVASFTPSDSLTKSTAYTATLNTNIADLSGNALASNYNWSFTTVGGGWSNAEPIETDFPSATNPQIAINNNGNALAVWEQDDNIMSNRFDGTSWGTAEPIDASAGAAIFPQIIIDNNGNALAVWQQDNMIMTNRFDGTNLNWGAAELIDENMENPNMENPNSPQIVIDNDGKALAVWEAGYKIMVNHFDGTSWGTAEPIMVNSAPKSMPQVVINNNGKAVVVWRQRNLTGNGHKVWANHFNGSSWGTAEPIDTSSGNLLTPQIAIDNNGNALAVWERGNDIIANRFDGTSWGTAEPIEADAGSAITPQIAFDNNGNALAVWTQSDGIRSNIMANRFDGTSSSWGTSEPIEAADVDHSTTPQIAIDNNGNALAVWMQSTLIMANHFDGTSWGTYEQIGAGRRFTSSPQIAIDNNGKALAVWQQGGFSTISIMASRFE